MKTIDDALAFADTFDKPANKYMSIVMLAAEVRRLQQENERLRKDAGRLDWLLSDFGKHCFSVDHAWDGESDLRPLIDALRGAKTLTEPAP